jgi:hypothetical protein
LQKGYTTEIDRSKGKGEILGELYLVAFSKIFYLDLNSWVVSIVIPQELSERFGALN